MTTEIKTAKIRDYLLSHGCREWQKDGHHRVYLTEGLQCRLFGLEITRYGTGNVSSARLDGEKISNGNARGYLSTMRGVYLDLHSGEIVGGFEEVDDAIYRESGIAVAS